MSNREWKAGTWALLFLGLAALGVVLVVLMTPVAHGRLRLGGPHRWVQKDMSALDQAVTEYAISNGGLYPERLNQLWEPDEHGHTYLKGPVPRDPWGGAYLYAPPRARSTYLIVSLGADGKPGGSGEDRDRIISEAPFSFGQRESRR